MDEDGRDAEFVGCWLGKDRIVAKLRGEDDVHIGILPDSSQQLGSFALFLWAAGPSMPAFTTRRSVPPSYRKTVPSHRSWGLLRLLRSLA